MWLKELSVNENWNCMVIQHLTIKWCCIFQYCILFWEASPVEVNGNLTTELNSTVLSLIYEKYFLLLLIIIIIKWHLFFFFSFIHSRFLRIYNPHQRANFSCYTVWLKSSTAQKVSWSNRLIPAKQTFWIWTFLVTERIGFWMLLSFYWWMH